MGVVVVAWRRMDAVVRDIGGALVPLVPLGNFIVPLLSLNSGCDRGVVQVWMLRGRLWDALGGGRDGMRMLCVCVWIFITVCCGVAG